MRWPILIATLAMTLGTALPLASADPSDNTSPGDIAFLATIANHGIGVPNPVRQAKAICKVLDDTDETLVDAARGMVQYNREDNGVTISMDDAGYFLGAAIHAYCPEYDDLADHPDSR